MSVALKSGAALGAGLVVVYTAMISSADAITKLIAGVYAAPQLYALSALIVLGLSVLADRHRSQRRGLATGCPRAMALRSVATVVAAVAFFNAFRADGRRANGGAQFLQRGGVVLGLRRQEGDHGRGLRIA